MKKATRDWVRKAEADFRGALRLAGADEPFHDLVAFHCQQSSEKYLKAMLEELGQHIPKTHALEDLLNLLLPSHGTLASVQRGLLFLTDFAVDPRYPGTGTSKRKAASFLALDHPATGRRLEWTAPLPKDMKVLLKRLRRLSAASGR